MRLHLLTNRHKDYRHLLPERITQGSQSCDLAGACLENMPFFRQSFSRFNASLLIVVATYMNRPPKGTVPQQRNAIETVRQLEAYFHFVCNTGAASIEQ